jgi:dTDP-4-dehydrorhamnose 3,5-epimerase
MHFQAPPKAYHKVVHCIKGRIHDVALDIRKGSPTYGQTWSSELTGENHAAVYLPPGLAHGFYCLENDSIVIYIVSAAHQPDFDQGIRWNSFNHRWPGNDPIVSTRDSSNYLFAEYNSPFDYE